MTEFFSNDYATAATRFCSAVMACGGQLESIALTKKGPADETLSIDIGWFGSPEPKRALLHSSGLRGTDGFAGSAIQLQWLELDPPKPPDDGAIVIVHALNPNGMDAQAARRFQLYVAQRLVLVEHIVAIDVRIGAGRGGDDRLVFDESEGSLGALYSRMSLGAKVDFATQEFGRSIFLFRRKWRHQVLESGKEVIENALERIFP